MTSTLVLAGAPAASFVVCVVVVRWLILGAARRVALDQPNERSLHSQPVPRLGGAGILAGTLVGWFFVREALTPALWAGAVLLAVVSLLDDIRGLPIGARFLAHFVAAGYFAASSVGGSLVWPLVVVVAIGIVWVTNLYNFMDGSDGLAGGMTLFGFGAYGVAAWLSHAPGFAIASFCVSAGAAGFLLFNFSPAKTFMGDVGSIPLGFLAASFGVFGWTRDLWPAVFPLLVFSPFVVDATVTLLARLRRREKIWQAHRSHYYQRLVLMGWTHRQVALAEYGLMLLVGASAVLCVRAPFGARYEIVVAWAVLYAGIMRAIDARWRQAQTAGS